MKTLIFVDYAALRVLDEHETKIDEQQHLLLRRLAEGSTIIPILRGHEFSELDKHEKEFIDKYPEAVISAFGGLITYNSIEHDKYWTESIAAELSEFQISLLNIEENLLELNEARNFGLKIKLVRQDYQNLYLQIVGNPDDPKRFQEFRNAFRNAKYLPLQFHEKYYVNVAENSLAVIPCALRLGFAVQYLIKHEKHQRPVLSIGVGNSLSDLSFMSVCDFWVTSSKSQLASTIYANINF